MSLTFLLDLLFWGGFVPAITAFVVIFVLVKGLPGRFSERWAMSTGIGLGFLTAYALAADQLRVEWNPQRNWHWLPYLVGIAMVLGPIRLAGGVGYLERWLVNALFALAAAWFLVPNWESLEPPRTIMVPALAGLFLVIILLLEPLPRLIPVATILQMCLVSCCVSVAVWACVSETYGRLGSMGSAATAGGVAAVLLFRNKATYSGLIPTWIVLTMGVAFLGFVYPRTPNYSLLLLPATILAVWSQSVSRQGMAVRIAGALIAGSVPIGACLYVIFKH